MVWSSLTRADIAGTVQPLSSAIITAGVLVIRRSRNDETRHSELEEFPMSLEEEGRD